LIRVQNLSFVGGNSGITGFQYHERETGRV